MPKSTTAPVGLTGVPKPPPEAAAGRRVLREWSTPRLARGQLEQLPQALTERAGLGVVRVVVEWRSLPTRVCAAFACLSLARRPPSEASWV